MILEFNFDSFKKATEAIPKTEENVWLRLNYWEAKAYHKIGNYLKALELTKVCQDDLLKKYSDLGKEFCSYEHKEEQKIEMNEEGNVSSILEVPEAINYIFLKHKLLEARLLKLSNNSAKCHAVCNSIMLYVKLYKDMTPSKFWLSAAKAAQL